MSITRIMRHQLEDAAMKLYSIGFDLGEDALLIHRDDKCAYACYINGGNPRCIDITRSAYPVKGALMGLGSYTYAVVSRPKYVCKAAAYGNSIPAVLDDMAQIAGAEIAVVPSDKSSLKSALRTCSAVMTDHGELITCGRSLYEAYACLAVAEKNAEIYLKAEVLGGADAINPVLAKAEHLYYLKKYSRAENERQNSDDSALPKEPSLAIRMAGAAKNKVSSRIARSANEGRISQLIDKIDERGEDSKLARIANKVGDRLGRPDVNSESIPYPIEAPAYLQDRFYKPEGTASDQITQFNPFTLSASDLKVAEELVEFGKKLVSTGLVQGTWGNISIRLDDTYMLCTPSGLDYESLKPEDMVKVDYHTLEYDSPLKPTSEKNLHAGIYRSRSSIGAIVHTHSKYCSIFAASDTTMETSDNTEVRCAAYAISGTEKLAQNTFKALGSNRACFMSHHGMVAVGENIEDAFKNCALVELTAKNYIEANYEK